VLATAHAGPGQSEGFFNEKDLTSWQGLTAHWSVKDGALVGSTHPDGLKSSTFLVSDREYGDFELRFSVRLLGPTANSGVQIRSQVSDKVKWAVKGPQCDMGQVYWGSLFGEHFGENNAHVMLKQSDPEQVKRVVKQNEFNAYHVRAVGKHVTIKINGETTVDGDFPTLPDKGVIAWQLHGGRPMEATFKDIQFMEIK
jgi:hypothetical protein